MGISGERKGFSALFCPPLIVGLQGSLETKALLEAGWECAL